MSVPFMLVPTSYIQSHQVWPLRSVIQSHQVQPLRQLIKSLHVFPLRSLIQYYQVCLIRSLVQSHHVCPIRSLIQSHCTCPVRSLIQSPSRSPPQVTHSVPFMFTPQITHSIFNVKCLANSSTGPLTMPCPVQYVIYICIYILCTHIIHQHRHNAVHTLIHCLFASPQNQLWLRRGLVGLVHTSEAWRWHK